MGGAPIWTDLAWSQLDQMLPPTGRRVVVSVQKAVEDAAGRFAGVARAALLASAVDAVSELRLGESDPHRIFISDADGRLITRLSPDDRLELVGDELRISPARLPSHHQAVLGYCREFNVPLEVEVNSSRGALLLNPKAIIGDQYKTRQAGEFNGKEGGAAGEKPAGPGGVPGAAPGAKPAGPAPGGPAPGGPGQPKSHSADQFQSHVRLPMSAPTARPGLNVAR